MTFTLRPFQEHGRDWLVERPRAILADQMGLGKTPQATAACAAVGAEKIVVVAPPRTVGGWRRHFDLLYPCEFQVAKTPKDLRALLRPGLFDPAVAFVPWSRLSQKAWTTAKIDLNGVTLVMDEAHFAKEARSTRSKSAWRLARSAERVMMLTATPLLSRPIEIQKALYHGCHAGDWAKRDAFGDRYCRQWNKWAPCGYDYLGAKNTDELAQRLAPYALRREVADVAPDMPGVVAMEVPLDISLPAELKKLEDDCAQWAAIAKATDDKVELPYGITFGQYRRLVAEAKASAIAAWAAEQQEPVLIFGHHRASLLGIAKKLNVPAVVGGTPDKTVAGAVESFQSGASQFLVAGIGVLGTGFDGLQHAANIVAFAEPAWVPGEMDQAVGRLRRIGSQSDVVRVYYLTAAGSSDAYIYNTLAQKSEVISEVLGASVRID